MRTLIALIVAGCSLACPPICSQTWEEVDGHFIYRFEPADCVVVEILRRPDKDQQLLYVGLKCGFYRVGRQYDPTGIFWPGPLWQSVQKNQVAFCPGEIVITKYAQVEIVHSFREYRGCRLIVPKQITIGTAPEK